jgi:hypothetical protein
MNHTVIFFLFFDNFIKNAIVFCQGIISWEQIIKFNFTNFITMFSLSVIGDKREVENRGIIVGFDHY